MGKREKLAAAILGIPMSVSFFYTCKIERWIKLGWIKNVAEPLLAPQDGLWILGLFVLFFGILLFFFKHGSRLASFPQISGKFLSLKQAAAILFLLWLPFLLVLYPGAGMNDTVAILSSPRRVTVQFPWIYSLALGSFGKISKYLFGTWEIGIFLFSLLQTFFMSVILGWVTCKMAAVTRNSKVGWLLLLYFGLFPMVGNYAIAAVRDPMFSAILLLCSFYMIEKNDGSWRSSLQFALLTVGLMAFRTNGAAIALLLAVIAGIQYRNKKIVVAFLAAILIVTIPGRILLSTVHKQPQFQEAVAIPLQQMSRVYVLKGNLTTGDKAFMESFLPEKQWHSSTPFSVDSIKWQDNFKRDLLNQKKQEFMHRWLVMGLNNPRLYMEAWMLETYHIWNWIWYDQKDQSRFGWALIDEHIQVSPANNNMLGVGDLPIPNGIKNTLGKWQFAHSRFFGSGLCFWLTVLACGMLYIQGKKRLILFAIPALANTGTLLLSTPASAVFRYSFVYVLVLPILWIFVFSKSDDEVK